MDNLESKNLALLRILQILEKYSDCNHPLTQKKIIDYLQKDYGIAVERKNVGRKISLLREALEKDGIYIETCKEGTYLDTRKIEDSELRMLIDGVLSSRYIPADQSKQLISKLCGFSNKYFKAPKNIYSVGDWNKTFNRDLFLNIELIDEAIEKEKKIQFNYNKYGVDKKLHKTSEQVASPYQLIVHNQRYYLMALNERYYNMAYYRVDHITGMQMIEDSKLTNIRTIDGYKNGINYKEFSSAKPYMFTDKAETVTFICKEDLIDSVIDWFGFDVKVQKHDDDRVSITLKVSPTAMEFWAMQYLNNVEILSPDDLREKIKQNVKTAAEKYSD